MNKCIKNLFLDLGGVILNIDPDKTLIGIADLLGIQPERLNKAWIAGQLMYRYETGKITTQDFRNGIRQYAEKTISDEMIDNTMNAMILDISAHRIEWLTARMHKYRLFLFSNTNELHFEKYNSEMIRQYGYGLEAVFERLFFSYRIGLRKPDLKAFRYVIEQSGIRPDETLFIDDLEVNIHGASAAGLNVYLLKTDLSEINFL